MTAEPDRILFAVGDQVLITYDGRTIEAIVELASKPPASPFEGQSLGLTFDAILGDYVGGMPIRLDPAGPGFTCVFHNRRGEIHPNPLS